MREMREHKVQYGKLRENAVQDRSEAKNDDESRKIKKNNFQMPKKCRFDRNLRPLKLAYVDSYRIYGPK